MTKPHRVPPSAYQRGFAAGQHDEQEASVRLALQISRLKADRQTLVARIQELEARLEKRKE